MTRVLVFCASLAMAAVAAPFATAQDRSAAERLTNTSEELERRDQPVTDDDLRILVRANQILSSPGVWNRHDTRECHDTDKTWSLFCALEKASREVLKEYRHREVALQEVRFAIEDVTDGRQFEHRLRDYNNLADTQLSDVKRVLTIATHRVRVRLEEQKKANRSR
jgi:hypothetical protein